MIEIGLGILVIAAALAGAVGLTQGLVAFPLSIATVAFVIVLGLLLLAHGLYRVRLHGREGDRHGLRAAGLAWLALVLLVALTLLMPLASPFLNAFSISGLPLGFYLPAQGIPIALVMLLFAFALRADVIDDQEDRGEE